MNFVSSLFWCAIGILGGFIVTLFFFIFSKKRQRITYKIDTYHLISNKFNSINDNRLEIKYNSTRIKDLYSSTISIINSGNTVIDKSDLAPTKPISISTKGQFLLNKEENIYLNSTNKASNISPIFYFDEVTNQCNHFVLDFDFLAKKEGIVFTLLHTDRINDLSGELKDGKIVNYRKTKKVKKNNNKLYHAFIRFYLLLFSLLVLIFLLSYNILNK